MGHVNLNVTILSIPYILNILPSVHTIRIIPFILGFEAGPNVGQPFLWNAFEYVSRLMIFLLLFPFLRRI